jgi:hypothetical protein
VRVAEFVEAYVTIVVAVESSEQHRHALIEKGTRFTCDPISTVFITIELGENLIQALLELHHGDGSPLEEIEALECGPD